MKKLTVFLIIIFPALLFAQESNHKSVFSGDLFKNLHPTYGTMDLYYTSSEINGDRMNGFGFDMGVAINDFWIPGFAMEFYSSRIIQLDAVIPVINPVYNTSFFEFSNEFMIGSKAVVSVGIPLRLGFGYTNYYDKYDNDFDNRSIADDTYFISDAGLNLYINILKNVSLSGGANYRYASGVQRIGSNDDFNNFSFSGKLRFRFFKGAKSVEMKSSTFN